MKISEINIDNLDNDLIKKLFFSIPKEEYDYADYIIVYGCHIKSLLDERLNHTLSIIKNKKYSKIVLTGGVGVNGDFNESEYMYNYLINNGVDKDKIIIEGNSTTTDENNINVLNILNINSISEKTNIVLVTQEVHMLKIILHLKKLVSNANIKFYYDYVDDSSISYENVINNKELLNLMRDQLEKAIHLIKENVYADYNIESNIIRR